MTLTISELDDLYDLVRERQAFIMRRDWDADLKEELSELHLLMHKLLKLQEENKSLSFKTFDGRTASIKSEPDGRFDFSTAETAKKLKVTESDLRALRNAKELKEGWHYITGKQPKPNAIWYDLQKTCNQLHGITWNDFSSPGFDFKAHTERRTAQAFAKARERMKK
tara:strand:- start:1100 stop:1600 length:501 start_codon:yes stop_codon:yes gene_type:complete